MIPFDLGSPTAAELADLSVGDFFMVDGENDTAVLAVLLSQLSNQNQMQLLLLTGENAFEIRVYQRRYREHVVPLKLEPSRVKLRIDFASSVKYENGQHVIGRLLFGGSMTAAIAAVYPELADKHYSNAVALRDWTVDQVQEPRFLFDRWALSYVDEAGQWTDLVRRDTAAR